MDVRRPACWCYPRSARTAASGGPERVIVSWSPCECPPALATRTLMDMGVARVAHMGGGFSAWKESGGPVVPKPTRKRET